jgi:hypothetical protein
MWKKMGTGPTVKYSSYANRTICYLMPIFIVFAAGRPAAAAAAASVEMELVTEKGFSITGSHDWYQMLTRIGVKRLRIRGLRPGESVTPRIREIGSPGRPHYQLDGLLTARGQLKLPGGTFRLRDSVRLKSYLRTLAVAGPQEMTAKNERFGVTLRELAELTDALTPPLSMSTRGTALADVVAAARRVCAETIVVEADARIVLEQGTAVAEELEGVSVGTALAAALGGAGLILQPRKPPGAAVQLAITRLRTGRDSWPVGWPPQRKPLRLLPVLFEKINVEIRHQTLAETLKAITPRLKVPVLFDYPALARQQINPAEIHVSLPLQRTYYKRILDRVLFQARLRSELRVDEAGKPLVWITPKP